MAVLLGASLAVLGIPALSLPASAVGTITFDGSPGTAAPPATLGPYSMTSFPADPQAEYVDVSSVAAPTGGAVAFAPDLNHRIVGSSWATWSHGYTGDVYFTNGGLSVVMTMPAGTRAFYFYAEPDPFAIVNFTATTQEGTTSGSVPVDGNGGATYFGFYAQDTTIETITVSSDQGFAVGEFGIDGGTATVTNVADPDAYVCSETGFIGFEGFADGFNLTTASPIGGVQFTTTDSQDWLVGDFDTGLYNGKYPSGDYTSQGTHWAWLGQSQGSGRIDFAGGPASTVSILTSALSLVVLEAYDASNTLLATAGPSSSTFGTGTMDELKITRPAGDIAYVVVHDTGNFFLVDSLCTDAAGVGDPPHDTDVTVTGPANAVYSDPATLSGNLQDTTDSVPVQAATLDFTVGPTGQPAQNASAGPTDALGDASVVLGQMLQTPGAAVPIGVSFTATTLGGVDYNGDTGAGTINVAKESCTVAYTGDTLVIPLANTELKAQFGESDATPGDWSGKQVTFTLTNSSAVVTQYNDTTDATGLAEISQALPSDVYGVVVSFAGDAYYNGCASPSAPNDTLITVQAAGAKARGGGWFSNPNRTNFGFNLIPEAGGTWKGQLQLRTNNGKGRFHGNNATAVTTPAANSVKWSGTGKWQGAPGYTYEITVVDNGSSGSKKGDTINVKIYPTGSPNSPVYSSGGAKALKGGNITVK